MRLTVELVPSSSWGHNVRSEVSSGEWKKIREKCSKEAGGQCEICGAGGEGKRRVRIDCHEIWEYDDKAHKQTLKGFVAICAPCHRVKHLGHTMSIGLGQKALAHLAKVNGMTAQEVLSYVDGAFDQWAKRSNHPWTVDISFLESYVR